ncbi:sigma-70 family RNA polymerase sigma factor [Crassaminicella profunda]|uniref:sigma-70 family RNA polymerase sigma factor n=1 Tax=Crassaminicella profunda TaxID=1286698 RepID=UPI001CA77414|nr:sigma-70 family RNA polymerase sigma factor [Crassaminicella profunda]QZY53814.1 sigma-70 family RNA polymerase sigma factor [Crassaminicella profunda]
MKKNTLDEIYQAFMEDIYYYLLSLCRNKHVAEDIMQETFFRAYLYFEDCSYDKVKPWLFRVAHNAYIDFVRKNSRSYVKSNDFFYAIADRKTPEGKLLIKEQYEEIVDLIGKLPEKQKQVLLLCDFNDLSYKEAAEIMNISLSYIKVLLFRARQHLRDRVERDECFE